MVEGLADGPFTGLTAYTEVLQDGMLNLIRSGKMKLASATALSLSSDAAMLFNVKSIRSRSASCCDRRKSPTIPK